MSIYISLLGTASAKEEGDEKRDLENRKRIGDFGCYLVFVHGLSAR